ncbi:hypothetical protein D3C76_1737790 [compost metagenome]
MAKGGQSYYGKHIRTNSIAIHTIHTINHPEIRKCPGSDDSERGKYDFNRKETQGSSNWLIHA